MLLYSWIFCYIFMTQRINWIDISKAIGMICVVIGHTITGVLKTSVYWFHMPLFFFISGYLYRPDNDYYTFLRKKSLFFLVPYISFLIIFSIYEYLAYFYTNNFEFFVNWQTKIFHKILGGPYIYGIFDVFWFITCLFVTQQVYNFLYCRFKNNKNYPLIFISIIVLAYCLAMLDSWFLPERKFPWSLNTVLFALPFYCLGHFFAQYPLKKKKTFILTFIIALIIFIIAIFSYYHLYRINLSIKAKEYSYPLINLILPMSGIILTQTLAILISKIPYLSQSFISIGKSSLIIMYLHQFIRSFLGNFSKIEQIVIALLISYLFYQIFLQFSLTRKLFLGDFKVKNTNLVT